MNKTKTRNLEEKNWEVKLGKMLHTCWTEYYTPRLGMLKSFYYIDTDEIPRLFLLLKNKIFIARRRKILFLSFTWEDIGVAVVTNMISQLQESFPFRHAAGFFWNFIHKMASRCEDSTVTGDFLDKLPNFHIDTFYER